MIEVPRQDGISQSKLKNLLLTASIVSLFVMKPDQIKAQEHTTQTFKPQTEHYKDYLMLFTIPQKDINVEFPGRDKYFLSLITHKSQEKNIPKKEIEHKTQVSPLSFTKRNIHKYFPEREACFKEIISTIQQDPILAHNINNILQTTIMKPRMVHKETNRRPRTEKDITGATLLFLEGTMQRTNFAEAIDQKDNVDEYRSDSITYKQRLAKIDRCEIAPEMLEAVLEADHLFTDRQKQLQAAIEQESDSIMASR